MVALLLENTHTGGKTMGTHYILKTKQYMLKTEHCILQTKHSTMFIEY